MNIQRQLYESNNLTAIILKIHETQFHKRNLSLIHNRKVYLTTSKSIPHFKPKSNPNPIYKFTKKIDDYKFNRKLSIITTQKRMPKINNEFLKIDQNHQISSSKKKKEIDNKIDKDNMQFLMKMNKIQPFISSKSMDKEFKKQQKQIRLQKSRQAKMTFPILGKSLSYAKTPAKSYHNQILTYRDKQEV